MTVAEQVGLYRTWHVQFARMLQLDDLAEKGGVHDRLRDRIRGEFQRVVQLAPKISREALNQFVKEAAQGMRERENRDSSRID